MTPIIGKTSDKMTREEVEATWTGSAAPAGETDTAVENLMKGGASLMEPADPNESAVVVDVVEDPHRKEPGGHVAQVLDAMQKAELPGEGYQPGSSADEDVVAGTLTTIEAFHQVDQDVSEEDDEPEDSIDRQADMVARESQEKYHDYWTNQTRKSLDTSGLDALNAMMSQGAVYAEPSANPETFEGIEPMDKAYLGGPYIGKRGGKWADPQHTIAWDEKKHGGGGGKTSGKQDAASVKEGQVVTVTNKRSGKVEKWKRQGNGFVYAGGDAPAGLSQQVQNQSVREVQSMMDSPKWSTTIGGGSSEGSGKLSEAGQKMSDKLDRLKGGEGLNTKDMAKIGKYHGVSEAEAKAIIDSKVKQGKMVENNEGYHRAGGDPPKGTSGKKEGSGRSVDMAKWGASGFRSLFSGHARSGGSPLPVGTTVMAGGKTYTLTQEAGVKFGEEQGKFKDGSGNTIGLKELASQLEKQGGTVTVGGAGGASGNSGKSGMAAVKELAADKTLQMHVREWHTKKVAGKHDEAAKIRSQVSDMVDKKVPGLSAAAKAVAMDIMMQEAKYQKSMGLEALGDYLEKGDISPEKARQILHDGEVNGKPLTEQQRKYFGAIGGHLPAPTTKKSFGAEIRRSGMTGIDSMADFLEKGGLPEGDHSNLKKPKSSAVGGSADGGELEGVGMTSGEAPLVGGQIPKVSPGKTEKLSEDDEDVERQMSPHKKPIETTRKSALPADQRDSVAHAQAVAVSRLRKSAGERQLSADEAAAELVKGDGFYHGAAPSLDLHQTVDLKSIQACPECEETFSKSLTACPSCGAGAVVSRPLPVMPQNQAVDPSRGLLRKSRNEADVRIGSVEPVQMTSQNGILIRR